MPLYDKRLFPEPMRSIDSATFSGAYQAVGTPLAHSSVMLIFVNNSSVIVTVSWDGMNDAFPLLPGATVIMDENSNASTGLVYISTFYSQ